MAISARHCVAHGYGLLFSRPLTIVGLTWLPALFYALGARFLVAHIVSAMSLAVPSASGLFDQYALFYFVALVALTAFFGALIAVCLTRQAFELHDETVAAYLVFGIREFRLFLALLRYYALVVSALALTAIVAGILVSQGSAFAAAHGHAFFLGVQTEIWLNSIASALAVILLVVLATRYGFLLDALAAAEDNVRLGRAHALVRQNFWPIAATLVAAGLPALMVLAACEMTFGGVGPAAQVMSPAQETSFALILTVGLVVLHTLFAGASARAYTEMAEAAAHEGEFAPHEVHHEVYEAPVPSMGFAHAAPAFVSAAPEPLAQEFVPVETVPSEQVSTHLLVESAAEPPPLEHAAPQEDVAAEAASVEPAAPTAEAAPVVDEHFGHDAHDPMPILAEVQAETAQTPVELAPHAGSEHMSAAHDALPAVWGSGEAEAHAEPAWASHPDIADAARESAEVASDHALQAALPVPPLDPAVALSARSAPPPS